MYRTLDDIEGRFVVVPAEEGVPLADVHNAPYPTIDYVVLEDGSRVPRIVVRPGAYEYPDTLANADGFSSTDMRPLSPMPVVSPEVSPRSAGISFADMVRAISPAAEPGVWRDHNGAPFWVPDGPRAISGPSFDDFVRTIDPAAVPDTWTDSRAPERTGERSPAVAGDSLPWTFSTPFGPFDPRSAAEMSSPRGPTAEAVPADPSLADRIAALGQALPDDFRRGEETTAAEPTAEQIREAMGSLFDRSPLDRPSFTRRQSQAYRGEVLPFSKDEDGNARFDPDAGIIGSIKRAVTFPGKVASGESQLYGPDGRLTDEAIEGIWGVAGLPAGGTGSAGRVAAGRISARRPAGPPAALDQVPGMTPERAQAIRALYSGEDVGMYGFPGRRLRPFKKDFPDRPGPSGTELGYTIDGARRTAKYTVGRRVVEGLDEAITPRELKQLVKKMTGYYPTRVPASRLNDGAIAQYNRETKRIFIWDKLDAETAHRAIAHEFGHHLANTAKRLVRDMPEAVQAEIAPLYSWGYKGTHRKPFRTPTTGDAYPAREVKEELLVEAVRAYLTNPNYLKTVAPQTAAYLRSKLNRHPDVHEHIQFNSKTGGPGIGGTSAEPSDPDEVRPLPPPRWLLGYPPRA